MSPAAAGIAALLLMRITGLVWVAPMLSSRAVPASVRTALSILFAVVLWPRASAMAVTGTRFTPPAVVGELLVGLVLGLAAIISVSAAEAAGDLLAAQMGLSGATTLDPSTDAQLPVVGQFLGLLTLTCILSVGGHRAILGALDASLRTAPLGSTLALDQGALAVAQLGTRLFWIGVRLAAPVVAAMAVTNAALGILARAAPQLNVLSVAFPLQIGLGLMVLGAVVPILFADVGGWPASYRELVGELMTRLAPRAAP